MSQKDRDSTLPPHNSNPYDLDRMAGTWAEMMRLSGKIAGAMAEKQRRHDWGQTPLDPFNLRQGWTTMLERMLQHPEKLTAAQFDLWRNYVTLWDSTLKRMTGGKADDVVTHDPSDRRFKSPAWQEDALFGFLRQSYLLTANWVMHMVEQGSDTLDHQTAQKLKFFTRQFVDALSPSNFALTNPDVVKATMESGGQNLVRGMRNMLSDIQRGRMAMTDENAFKVGENLATTQGQVIFRNRMMELIHYAPAGDTTYKTPLLIVPPWINKFYILDLRPDNSFVRWCLAQGHAVFMVSWVNPDITYKDVSFEDYMQDGILAALDAIEKQTGEKSANVIGYCIGGTLLALTLAWLKAKKQDRKITSATFFTTLIDFDQSGDLKLFVDEEQLQVLSGRMAKQGFLDADGLRTTFNMLRANDLIWTFVVNNYLLGRDPFPFDLLYWNGDSTNLRAHMHEFYLRHMYLKNDLAHAGRLKIGGVKMDVGTIETPAYFISSREDHIAPWRSTYAGARLLGGDVTFTLAGSGHIAGIVNHPDANKYGYWTSAKLPVKPEAWLDGTKETKGSWWPHWAKWLSARPGAKVKAVDPAKGPLKPLCAAPGTYVKSKS